MEDALYLAYIGYKGIWFSSGRNQLEQPKEYLRYIIDRSPLLQGAVKTLLTESVLFKNGGQLKLKNLTELNARSSRADFIVYDEEAQADEAAYNAAVSILAGSNLGFIFHISTAAKATIFETNHDRIKARQKKYNYPVVFYRPWYSVGFLWQKKEWYEEEKERVPGWYFRQEHECGFELPSGAVFKNVLYGAYSQEILNRLGQLRLCSGVDWNPVSGHWLVGVKWTEDMKHVYVMEAHDLGNGYTHEMTQTQFSTIQRYYINGNTLTVEEGGINDAYVKWLKEQKALHYGGHEERLHYEEWDSVGKNKLNTCNFITQNGICIHIDEDRFPTLAKQIRDCHWETDTTEIKIAKDPADSPHAFDGFLHACSSQNRIDNVIEISW